MERMHPLLWLMPLLLSTPSSFAMDEGRNDTVMGLDPTTVITWSVLYAVSAVAVVILVWTYVEESLEAKKDESAPAPKSQIPHGEGKSVYSRSDRARGASGSNEASLSEEVSSKASPSEEVSSKAAPSEEVSSSDAGPS